LRQQWRFAQDQPTVADTSGNINNICDLTAFESTLRDDTTAMDCQDYIVDDSKYGEYVPGMGDYTTGPPPLPPHLRQIILNSVSFIRFICLSDWFVELIHHLWHGLDDLIYT
jgi:hypothetical protein